MAERKVLTNGNAFKRTDGRWNGVVWYVDEAGERKRKSFSASMKAEVMKRMRKYIEEMPESNLPSGILNHCPFKLRHT